MSNNFEINRGRGGERSYSISLIRLIALLMIITCHVFQYLENELAWWFNVGVQIFLCISGYLYGQKETGEIKDFYKRRFGKILVPYYIVIIPAILLNLFCGKIGLSQAISAFFMRGTLTGGGHLWFVSTILFCYVVTPILESFYLHTSKRGYILTTLFALEIIALYCFGFADYYNGAWVGCYVIGYAVGVNENKHYLSEKVFLVVFGTLALGNILQIYIDYIGRIEFSGVIGQAYSVFKSYNHVWLGVFVFLILKMLFDKYECSQSMRQVMDISDGFSYETYLVHQFLILGPFSLMALTPYVGLNIIIIIFCIGILSWLLKHIETYIFDVGKRLL